jgi:uncharacterized protein
VVRLDCLYGERILRKDAANQRKHGVGFREAATVFGDPLAATFPGTDHSILEHRFLTIGASVSGCLLVVPDTESDDTIRVISARTVTPHKRRFYEEAQRLSTTRAVRRIGGLSEKAKSLEISSPFRIRVQRP